MPERYQTLENEQQQQHLATSRDYASYTHADETNPSCTLLLQVLKRTPASLRSVSVLVTGFLGTLHSQTNAARAQPEATHPAWPVGLAPPEKTQRRLVRCFVYNGRQ